MIDVVWFSEEEGTIQRGYWDMGWLEAFFDRTLWRPPAPLEFVHRMSFTEIQGNGAVVVVAGRWNVSRVDRLTELIARLEWVVLIVTSDEENVFPVDEVKHPNLVAWVQTPRPSNYNPEWRVVGEMWPPDMPRLLAGTDPPEKDLPWFFAGQVNNKSRSTLVRELNRLGGGELTTTKVFGSGLEYPAYVDGLRRARVVPAPSGPFAVDTFRLFEALEAGCVPVAELRSPNYREDGYWEILLGSPPFPVVDNWSSLPRVAAEIERDWPVWANRCSAWWQGYKRRLALRLEDDIRRLSGQRPAHLLADDVVVLIPTSPSPIHPETSHIEETVESVLAQKELVGCEIFLMIDGVHSNLEERRADYEEYQRRLLWLTEHRWPNVLPIRFEEHAHQASMTRAALEETDSAFILFVEHDAPLDGEIPWEGLAGALRSEADVIRLHHEASVLPDHRHLMLDRQPQELAGVPMIRTVQWSQRPHFANRAFYRRILSEFFGEDARTMIEDVMHGVIHTHWREYGLAGWDRFRLWMYAPQGNMKRSRHLDSRGEDAHVPMVFAYDGETPLGAPRP